MIMFNKNGLLYSMLDAKGNKIGVPIKASALYCKPTIKNLETHFQRGTLQKQSEKERLLKIVDSFFHAAEHHTRVNFAAYMNVHGVNAIFRENKDGRVYGVTFIDDKNGAVFNGSDLKKQYSDQTLIKRLDDCTAGAKESAGRIERGLDLPPLKRYDYSQADQIPDIAQAFFELMEAEKFYPGPTNPVPKRRRKPKRRKSI